MPVASASTANHRPSSRVAMGQSLPLKSLPNAAHASKDHQVLRDQRETMESREEMERTDKMHRMVAMDKC